MTTDDMILALTADVRAVPRFAVARRIGIGIAIGAAVSLALVASTLGLRADLWTAMHGHVFWMKWGYTLSLSVAACFATARLARPDAGRLGGLWWMTLPVGLLLAAAIGELYATPRAGWLAMWLGRSWLLCPWLVLASAMPVFAGLIWAFRRLAPTRLRAAGAAAGLTAGAVAATVYGLHCPEVSALFVLSWYSLGVLLATGAGALLGPRLLRW